jgi:phage shock protein C
MSATLYRSRENQIIGGVCAGLARYLNIDVTIIRIVFVLLALGEGSGILLYLILWLIMPAEDQVTGGDLGANIRTGAAEMKQKAQNMGAEVGRTLSDSEKRRNTTIIIGSSLIALGVFFLIETLNIPWLWWLDFDILWPILLVIGGIFVLYRALRGE